MLNDDEKSQMEPFWQIDDVEESRVIGAVLKRRFPETFAILTESLELADPLDVVYPNNPDEYSDVIAEIIVLLAAVNGDLGMLSIDQLDGVVRIGIARRFGESPDEDRVRRTVGLIAARVGLKM